MSVGKLAAQVAHASYTSAMRSKSMLSQWEREGQKKVVLIAKTVDEIIMLAEKCKKLDIPHSVISDAGMTELEPGTITTLGIGPFDEKSIDKVTGSLPLLK